MERSPRNLMAIGLACGVIAGAAQADELFTDDVIIFDNLLCVGFNCLIDEPEIPGRSGLKVNDFNLAILFDDISSAGNPNVDWQITINDTGSGGSSYFQIEDITNGTAPFRINSVAPTSAFVLNTIGNVGLGTAFPQEELHILDGVLPGIRLERDGSSGFPARAWEVNNSVSSGFIVSDVTAGTTPLAIRSAAPSNAAVITQDGSVGLGTPSPAGKLHTRGSGVQLAYFESSNGDAVQVRFRTNSENRRFLAVNNADQVQTQMQFRDDEILFLGQTVAQEWLSVSAAGITTAGPSCSSPCDAVFDPDTFTVPPIEDRAALMWAQKHLPAIGPTAPDQPINLTEKMGGVIHELEVAHIYIEDLHTRLRDESTQRAAMRATIQAQDEQLAEQAAVLAAQQDQMTELMSRIERLERTR